MNYALWGDRVLAFLIDAAINLVVGLLVLAIVYALGIAMTVVGGSMADDAGNRGQNNPVANLLATGGCFTCFCGPLLAVPLVTLIVGLFNKVYLIHRRGCSIGQGFMKLRVVGPHGERVPHKTLFLRLFVQVLLSIIWVVSLLSILWPLWDPRRQALHDKAVDTFVIKV